MSPLNTLFLFSLISGTLLSISSSSWFTAWVGLELNLLAFIPLIVSGGTRYSSEAALKYFLIQALGSSLIILSSASLMISSSSFPVITTIALLLKLGSAPFHFWFPQIMEGLMWPQTILLMTIQKMAPIFLLSYLINSYNVITLILISSMMSAIMGAAGGINQTSLRKIMAFSSINHMAWLLAANIISENLLFLYFSFYCLISSTVALVFFFQQSYFFNHLLTHNNLNSPAKAVTFMSLLSLGGLPPFTGFVPKWFLIQELINSNYFFLLAILLASTLVTLYFYLRVAVSFLNLSYIKLTLNPQGLNMCLMNLPFFTALNLFGLFLPLCFVFY